MVTIEVNTGNIAELGSLTKETIKNGLNLTAMNMINELMSRSPVDQGLLKQWAVTSQSDDSVTIQSPANYAAFQNYGTSAHFIAPTNAKALHWNGGFFSKGHMVSGISGKHFVEESIEATSNRISEFFSINGG